MLELKLVYRKILLLGILALPLVATGCLQQDYRLDAEKFRGQMAVGNWQGAATIAQQSGKVDPEARSGELLWSLNDGAASLFADNYKHSIAVFDHAEKLMKFDDLAGLSSQIASGASSVLVNDTVRDYSYSSYDAIMVNSYKGLAFMLAGELDNARVEFNRTAERQRRAAERYALEIKAEESKNAAAAKKNPKVNSSETLTQARTNPELTAELAKLESKSSYAPFVNPYTSYLRSIFLLAAGESGSDTEQAITELRSVLQLIGDNRVVKSDLAYALARANGKGGGKRIWVMFENGQSPIRREKLIHGFGFTTVGVIDFKYAVPFLQYEPLAYPALRITVDEQEVTTETVTNFDAVVAAEFKLRLPGIITRAVLSTAYKTAIQIAGQVVAAKGDSNGNSNAALLGGLINLAGVIATEGSTAADLRSWLALPKEFQAASFAAPRNGRLAIHSSDGVELGFVTVATDKNALITVKIQNRGARPVIQTTLF
ncbi:MAG: hypothetical protein ORO03_07585 [Alphaproteobacteria bacterium]|nr:hypothetical protein [Alphaproteobacteria bacterium]